jgi:hypothetical protein
MSNPAEKEKGYITFDTGVIAMVTGGRNMGRVGVVTHRERHDGGFNIVHIKDAIDNTFATRESNVFVIGEEKPWISLPKGKGVQVSHAARIIHRRRSVLTSLFLAHNRGRKRSPQGTGNCGSPSYIEVKLPHDSTGNGAAC